MISLQGLSAVQWPLRYLSLPCECKWSYAFHHLTEAYVKKTAVKPTLKFSCGYFNHKLTRK